MNRFSHKLKKPIRDVVRARVTWLSVYHLRLSSWCHPFRPVSLPKLWCNFLFFGVVAPTVVAIGAPVALSQSEPVYWPRLDFIIPFQIDNNGQTPREVLLEVSEDTGQNWSLYSRGDTRSRQFQYKAARDGEYIFRLKTVDGAGRRFDNPGDPLRIVIDTTKPTGSLVAGMDHRGEMLAEFLISDTALDAASITLEYQSDVSNEWIAIPFQLSRSTTPGEVAGNATWRIPDSAKQLVVRLVAKDKAGNFVEVTKFPQLPKTASYGRGVQFASQPVSLPDSPFAANDPQRQNEEMHQSSPQKLVRLTPPTQMQSMNSTNSTVYPNSSFTNQSTSSSTERTAISNSQGPAIVLGPLPSNLNSRTKTDARGVPIRELSESEVEAIRNRDGFQLTGSGGAQSLITPSVQGKLNTSQSNSPSMETPTLGSPREVTGRGQAIEPLFSNTRAFSLDYRIENDPGSPITEVELWGTVDQGRTWEVWGLDPDRTTPFDIEVENDGLFGFRMVIVGANGLASNRPRNGDSADAWIHVDTLKPQARISSALYGTGKDAGSLVIEYHAADEFFGERPISLFYSESPNGPWEVISKGVRNQGRFVWPSNPSLPPTIYLKIEAIDSAGNVAGYVLDAPVNVEGIAPRGRIQGFRPLSRQ